VSLADIDAAATRRRIQDIADDARKAFAAHAQHSIEIDAAAREAAAKEEADLRAALQRKAEAEAARDAARAAAEQQQEPDDKPKPRPKPSTLSLGAEEFKLERQARQSAEQAKPEPTPVQAEPEPVKEALPRRTMKLGGRDDEDVPQQDKPVRKRTPRAEVDDDMSGRTWLR